MRTQWIALAAALSLAACTGADGQDGTNGTNGTDGMDGQDGQPGGTVILSEKAKQGLDIAPVALDLTGLDGAGIEQVGQGSYLVNAVIDCSGCHGEPGGQPGYLAGGIAFPFDADGHFVNTRNLTPDPTTGLQLTEAQFLEVMHTGRDFSNNGGNGLLIIMPWNMFRWMAEDDLRAIYAYLKVIPAVDNAVAADNKGPADALTPIAMPATYDVGDQERAIPPDTTSMGAPLPDPDGVLHGYMVNPLADPPNYLLWDAETQARFDRGSYLVNAAACNDCHTNAPYDTNPFGGSFLHINTTQYLSGGAIFAVPMFLQPVFAETRSMSANLIGETNGFFNEPEGSFTNFDAIIASGLHVDDGPDALPLAWPMPADHFRNMTTEDLVAVYTYVRALAAEEPTTGANDKLTQIQAVYCDANITCPAAYTSCHMDTTIGNECVGNSCGSDADCGACQHCNGTTNVCDPPDATNDAACLALGI